MVVAQAVLVILLSRETKTLEVFIYGYCIPKFSPIQDVQSRETLCSFCWPWGSVSLPPVPNGQKRCYGCLACIPEQEYKTNKARCKAVTVVRLPMTLRGCATRIYALTMALVLKTTISCSFSTVIIYWCFLMYFIKAFTRPGSFSK